MQQDRVEAFGTDIEALRKDLAAEVHDLAQPLTMLFCRLELGATLREDAGLREVVVAGLADTRKVFASLARLRERLEPEARTARGAGR